MRRRPAMMAAAAVLGAAFVTGAGAAAGTGARATAGAVVGGSWGPAVEVPGTGTLNKGGQAGAAAISCADSGDCSAGGFYASARVNYAPILQAFVANRTGGHWQKAEEVPGSAAVNGGNARVLEMSCASAGDCLAGGWYTDASGHRNAFVVSETGGTWTTAKEVPGTAALNNGSPGAEVTSVSCAVPGDCLVGGRYTNAVGQTQAFVVSETNGAWGTAEEVPGTAALNKGGFALINSVSCASAGNCSAGGRYAPSSKDGVPVAQAFVVTETNGIWGTVKEVPGTAALNSGGYAEVDSVSCASAGNCSAGGAYTNGTPATEAFVATETNGTWGLAEEVPGTTALNSGGLAQVNSVSCTMPGNCSAGGFYLDASFDTRAFVVNEANGTWGTAADVPGVRALDQGSPGSKISSVSCASAGNCSAGGSYSDASNHQQAFVVNQTGGTWGTAEEVPGIAALNTGGLAGIGSVSCAPGGLCGAAGSYSNASNPSNATTHVQAFVVTETGG